MTRLELLLAGVAALALASCASTPVRFHTLVAPPAAEAAKTAAPYAFDLLAVSIPAQVNVPQLVVRESAGELVPVDSRHWIAPLSDEIRDALSAQLAARLGARDVHRVTVPDSAKVYRVQVDLRRFESALGQSAQIEALWSVRSRIENRALTCPSDISQPIGGGYEALVEGHQHAIAELARQIAAGVAAMESAEAASCPGK